MGAFLWQSFYGVWYGHLTRVSEFSRAEWRRNFYRIDTDLLALLADDSPYCLTWFGATVAPPYYVAGADGSLVPLDEFDARRL